MDITALHGCRHVVRFVRVHGPCDADGNEDQEASCADGELVTGKLLKTCERNHRWKRKDNYDTLGTQV